MRFAHPGYAGYSREADDIVRETDAGNPALARQFAKRQEASRLAKFKANIVEASRPQREELLRPLAKVAADAEFLLSLCQSPTQMLGRVALGDTKRTQYRSKAPGRLNWKRPRSPRLPRRMLSSPRPS